VDPVNFEFGLRNSHSSQGTVTLRSADPLEPPEINFRFFGEGGDEDLQAMLEAVTFVEKMKAQVAKSSGLLPMPEIAPCPSADGRCTSAQIKNTLKTQVYSRHATGTCAIGDTSSDPMAVLDSKFRVKGVNRLRVVDASVFPKPPGAFPILPTFMISRKAAKVIHENAE
jgi:choline dehydrogenase